MKKIFAAASAVIMSCALFSCGSEDKSEPVIISTALSSPVIDPLTDYFEGYNNDDPDRVIKSMYPEVCIDAMKANKSYDELITDTKEVIQATHDLWSENYGANSSLKAKSSIMGSEMSGYELFCAGNYLDACYTELGLEFKVTEGYAVKFDYIVQGSTDKLEGEQHACLVKPEDDDWKLIMADIDTVKLYNGANVTLGNGENDEEKPTDQN